MGVLTIAIPNANANFLFLSYTKCSLFQAYYYYQDAYKYIFTKTHCMFLLRSAWQGEIEIMHPAWHLHTHSATVILE